MPNDGLSSLLPPKKRVIPIVKSESGELSHPFWRANPALHSLELAGIGTDLSCDALWNHGRLRTLWSW